jgi:hypothetical protein
MINTTTMEQHFYAALEPVEREEVIAQGLAFSMLFELYRDDPRVMPMYYASLGQDITSLVTVDNIEVLCDALIVAFNSGRVEEVIASTRPLLIKVGTLAQNMPTSSSQEALRRKCFSLASVVGAELTKRGIR